MNRGIHEIRKSIARRHKLKRENTLNKRLQPNDRNKINVPMPQPEEQHGYLPIIQNDQPRKKQTTNVINQMMMKGILSAILFIVSAIILHSNTDFFSKPKQWAYEALGEEFPFATVHQWYQDTFGTPLSFTPDRQPIIQDAEPVLLPITGDVVETFQTNGSGIMIAPDTASVVSSWDGGVVIFSGNDRQKGQTIVIQHADKSKTTYGYLSSIDVHLYQYV